MQQSKNPSKHKQLETWKLSVQILYLHNSYNIWKKGNYIVQFKPTVSPQPKVFSQSNRKSLPKVQTVNVRPPICSILFSPTYLQSTASPGPQRQSDLHWEPETSLLPPMFTWRPQLYQPWVSRRWITTYLEHHFPHEMLLFFLACVSRHKTQRLTAKLIPKLSLELQVYKYNLDNLLQQDKELHIDHHLILFSECSCPSRTVCLSHQLSVSWFFFF